MKETVIKTLDHKEHSKHSHEHTKTKEVINRMSRLIGHAEAIKKMVENGRDCTEILIQISAVRSALNNVGKIILEDHINHCIVHAIEENDFEEIEKLNDAIKKFIK
ncbi:MAG: metal-sensing transcriptional repressor [Bacillota bacterium]|nr:metal-sensing transcriptional repressor [Bacillota bacterium]